MVSYAATTQIAERVVVVSARYRVIRATGASLIAKKLGTGIALP